MVLCIAVTAGFRNKSQIGNAYGEFARVMQSFIFLISFPAPSIDLLRRCLFQETRYFYYPTHS